MVKIFKRKVIVDTWKTGMHGEIIGIRQKEQHRSKEKQFTKDMELFGEVKELKDGKEETIGYIGYRKSLWDDKKNKLERRLVIKLFSKSMYYQATLEEVLSRELMARLVWSKTYPCFTSIVEKHPYLTTIDKVKRTFPLFDWFSMRIVDDEKGMIPIVLKHKIGLGDDYRIINIVKNETLGVIDGKKFDIGGQYAIKLETTEKSKEIINDNTFVRCLILFAASIRFHGEIEKKIRKTEKLLRKGKWSGNIDEDELGLYRNPRSQLKR